MEINERMKINEGLDLVIGIGWILISIMQTIIFGWRSWIVWGATLMIWIFIIRTRLDNKLKRMMIEMSNEKPNNY